MFLYTVKVICREPRAVEGQRKYRVVVYDTIATTGAEARAKTMDAHRERAPEADKAIRGILVDSPQDDGVKNAGEYYVTPDELNDIEGTRQVYSIQ